MHPETSDLAVTPSADNAKHKPIMVVGRKVPEKVICEICSKLVSKANYKNHIKHHEPPTMECPKCDGKLLLLNYFSSFAAVKIGKKKCAPSFVSK